jgi:RNA polymerase-binding transcription factor DksA
MTGYIGNAGDNAQQLAQDHVDNLVHHARQYFDGRILNECEDCGNTIPKDRIEALKHNGCTRCIECQGIFDKLKRPHVRMLDHIL